MVCTASVVSKSYASTCIPAVEKSPRFHFLETSNYLHYDQLVGPLRYPIDSKASVDPRLQPQLLMAFL
jgi:hypothetical protein